MKGRFQVGPESRIEETECQTGCHIKALRKHVVDTGLSDKDKELTSLTTTYEKRIKNAEA
jgi:hypothetical protein